FYCWLIPPIPGIWAWSEANGQELRREFAYDDNLLLRKSPSHCGLYSLYAVAHALGDTPEIEKLIDADFLSSEMGSSPIDLQRAADMIGLHATPVAGWSLSALRSSEWPVLLNLSLSEHGDCAHWIAWLGEENGQALIYDPLSNLETVPYGLLIARWKGVAVIVGKERPGISNWIKAKVAWLSWLLFPLCAFFVLSQSWKHRHRSSLNEQSMSFMVAVSMILLTLFVWFTLDYFCNDSNSLRNSASTLAANCITSAHNREIARMADYEFDQFLRQGDGYLVDSRPEGTFELGTIQGSINIPINIPLFDFVLRVNELDRSLPVVVFCERASCEWDQIVAGRLNCVGFRDVRVYEPGIEGYLRRQEKLQRSSLSTSGFISNTK
ncbi:MAG TPA: rhodanese-like domain-containing protein, partial [Pirellulaceae bacterium]|nr:rhodanese-like domain-containing protein [Pirellulaceae bacterium]HMP71205.1 rhodanese-like domain-containing protein [Pirellulaceae bacterium]